MGPGDRPCRGRSGGACLALALFALLAGALQAMAADPLATWETSPSPTEGRRTLPDDLVPSLDAAADIRPRAYTDGCHARAGDTRARACSYGVKDAPFSVLLIGDSHALQWLPALEDLAQREGWRIYSLTKSACPVPRIPVIVRGERLRDCEIWRRAAFDRVAELHPDVVLAASLGRIYQVPRGSTAERRARLWRRAWTRSLEALRERAGRVFLLGDTPMWRDDPIECLRRHRRDIDRCDTPRAVAISSRTESAERDAARAAGVDYVPTADLVCPDDPCRAVEGRYLVLGDVQHMTVAWARRVSPALLERLGCAPPPLPSGSPPLPSGSPDASTAPHATVSLASAGPSPTLGHGLPVSCPR